MRTLTSDALLEKDAATHQPVLVLAVDFGGATGTKRYADADLSAPVTAEGRILDTDGLDDADGTPQRMTVRLSDHDGALSVLFDDPGFRGKAARVLRCFRGLGESDMIPLLAGTVTDARVVEKTAEVALTLGDLSAAVRERAVGAVCDRTVFPRMRPEDEGAILPIVYGRPRRVEAICVSHGATTVLAAPANADATTLIVDDASRFPTGATTIRVGAEEMEGSFDGNVFTVSARPRVVASGTAEAAGNPRILRDTTLPATDDHAYAGLCARCVLGGRTQHRRVEQYVAAAGALVLEEPFILENGDAGPLPAGTSFDIVSPPASHPAGAPVREVLDEYVYVAAGHACVGVDAVEVRGEARSEIRLDGLRTEHASDGFVALPPTLWRANTNDATTLPQLDVAVTTVIMERPPSALTTHRVDDDRLWVSVRGRDDGSGGVLEHPAEVIRSLLVDCGGTDAGDLDDDAFDEAASARADLSFAFALREPRSALETAADLAFQAGLALTWTPDGLGLRALRNDLGEPSTILDADDMEAGSVVVADEPLEEAVTEIVAEYEHRGAPAALTVRYDEAEENCVRRLRRIRFGAFQERRHVRAMSEFHLRRLRRRSRRVTLTAFLRAVEIERGDTVGLDRIDLFAEGQAGRVVAVDHLPGRLADGRIDRIGLVLELPVGPGCASTCEVACESTACESASCEMACTVGVETGCAWSCESSCEEACQISCTVSCELSCQGTCQLSCRAGEESASCASSCESGCESSCEGWACESGAETGCAATCQAATTETIFPVRQVTVVTAPSSQHGSGTVLQVDREGNTFGDAFTAWDPFDIHPSTDDMATVYLNFNYQWVFVSSARNVRLVRILGDADESGKYWFRERSVAGSLWGDSFCAWAVDSV